MHKNFFKLYFSSSGPSRIKKIKAMKVSDDSTEIHLSWSKPKNDTVTYYYQTYINGQAWRVPTETSKEEVTVIADMPSAEYSFEVWGENLFGQMGEKVNSSKIYTSKLFIVLCNFKSFAFAERNRTKMQP